MVGELIVSDCSNPLYYPPIYRCVPRLIGSFHYCPSAWRMVLVKAFTRSVRLTILYFKMSLFKVLCQPKYNSSKNL